LAGIESLLISNQSNTIDPATTSLDNAIEALTNALQSMQNHIKVVKETATYSPEELGIQLKNLSSNELDAIQAMKEVVGNLDDILLRKQLLNETKETFTSIDQFVYKAKGISIQPTNEDLSHLLMDAAKSVVDSLQGLLQLTGTILPSQIEKQIKSVATDIEELAEKELSQAENVIAIAIAKINKAKEEAKAKMESEATMKEEAIMIESMINAVGNIGQYTANLVSSATSVQQDYNKQRKSVPKGTGNPYRRDPTWAKGLISSSQQVAAAVSHLVHVSELVNKGEASIEALIVAGRVCRLNVLEKLMLSIDCRC
jgi:hypothetical protein